MARGLDLIFTATNYLKLFCTGQSLVLVINATSSDQEQLLHELEVSKVPLSPKVVTADTPAVDRIGLYRRGGVVLVTSRILVVDLLLKRLYPSKLTGVVVFHADRVTETSTEAFILRLYRQGNQEGFIKAFSDNPEGISSGLMKLEQIMRCLHLRKMLLYPRVQATVKDSLSKHTLDIVQLNLDLTPAMQRIQDVILKMIDQCMQQLKQTNRVDIHDLKTEDALFRSFDVTIRSQLAPVWHKLPRTTRQIVNDLKTLRKLLTYLVRYDCITFYTFLESLRHTEGALGEVWIMMDEAHAIFKLAKDRVYRVVNRTAKPVKRRKIGVIELSDSESSSSDDEDAVTEEPSKRKTKIKSEPVENETAVSEVLDEASGVSLAPVLETNPKWQLTVDVLEEIREANKQLKKPGHTLIITRDDRTSWQVSEVLNIGEKEMMNNKFHNFLYTRKELSKCAPVENNSNITAGAEAMETEQQSHVARGAIKHSGKRGRGGGKTGSSRYGRGRGGAQQGQSGRPPVSALVGAKISQIEELLLSKNLETDKQPSTSTDTGADTSPTAVKTSSTTTSASKVSKVVSDVTNSVPSEKYPNTTIVSLGNHKNLIYEKKPNFIIMYDCDLALMRELEVYKARHPGKPVRVYFLVYESSVDLQKYVYSVTRERESFEMLMRENAIVVYADHDADQHAPQPSAVMPSSMRKMTSKQHSTKVIVDMREFRSALPSMLHQRGIEVIPATLEVGDYILSPEICVERKSVDDLFGSFASGRLYNQAEQMTRYYKSPILLVEFDQTRSFSLQADVPYDISPFHISSKIVLLTLHFPTLRIVWSRSPVDTAKLLEDIKSDCGEPSVEAAVACGTEAGIGDAAHREDNAAFDLLRRLPGVTQYNVHAILHKVDSVAELFKLSLSQMTVIMGGPQAKALYEFVNRGL